MMSNFPFLVSSFACSANHSTVYPAGCDGGFPYLIGGKYAEDFGVVEEECNPYTGEGGKECQPLSDECKSRRFHATQYEYVGGYYGA